MIVKRVVNPRLIGIANSHQRFEQLWCKSWRAGKTGMFEFIKDADGVINHRYFNINK